MSPTMKKAPAITATLMFSAAIVFAAAIKPSHALPAYALTPVPLARVEVADPFWSPRMETNQRVSIWHCFKKSEETSSFDSPKLIEAATYMLAKGKDAALETAVDAQIEKLGASTAPRASDPDRAVRVFPEQGNDLARMRRHRVGHKVMMYR
jgi:hypothetical protein